jgi:hypothetical protein
MGISRISLAIKFLTRGKSYWIFETPASFVAVEVVTLAALTDATICLASSEASHIYGQTTIGHTAKRFKV